MDKDFSASKNFGSSHPESHQDSLEYDMKGTKEFINATLEERKQHLKKKKHLPRLLAMDGFATHKGHRYAACIMELESGEIIWVGKGQSKNDFAKFFE